MRSGTRAQHIEHFRERRVQNAQRVHHDPFAVTAVRPFVLPSRDGENGSHLVDGHWRRPARITTLEQPGTVSQLLLGWRADGTTAGSAAGGRPSTIGCWNLWPIRAGRVRRCSASFSPISHLPARRDVRPRDRPHGPVVREPGDSVSSASSARSRSASRTATWARCSATSAWRSQGEPMSTVLIVVIIVVVLLVVVGLAFTRLPKARERARHREARALGYRRPINLYQAGPCSSCWLPSADHSDCERRDHSLPKADARWRKPRRRPRGRARVGAAGFRLRA